MRCVTTPFRDYLPADDTIDETAVTNAYVSTMVPE